MELDKLAEVFKEESRSVGLKNIQDRLTRLGGAGLRIESVQNEYTKVSFTVGGVGQMMLRIAVLDDENHALERFATVAKDLKILSSVICLRIRMICWHT